MTPDIAVDTIDIASDGASYDNYSAEVNNTMDMPTEASADGGFKLSNNVILGIIIGVCAVIGIVLGIIFGRRAANK